jgi:hypothetical protein
MSTRRAIEQLSLVVMAIALAYLVMEITSYALFAIVAALPLFRFRKRTGFIAGLAIGFLVPVSTYLSYPAADVEKLSSIISSIAGLPVAAVILIYPAVFALTMGFSALLFSGIYEEVRKRRTGAGGRSGGESQGQTT